MLVVLGGSSPWTLSLLRSLNTGAVVLVGRDADALEDLRRFAGRQGGPAVHVSTRPDEALAEASLVICQARIGGAAGRLADETEAQRWGGWGNETLGIGGLRGALRSLPTLASWATAAVGKPALMVTNPTDLLTRWWAAHSRAPCISVCEVPTLLLRDLPPETRYLGINHAGYAITPEGELRRTEWLDLLDELPGRLEQQRRRPPRRATIVSSLARRLRRAIAVGDGEGVDRMLALRETSWNELLVAPLVDSILDGGPFRGVVGLSNGSRLPSVDPDVIVESLGSALAPEPLGVERRVAERVGRLALGRQRAWDCLVDLNETTLRGYLTADPFAAGVHYSHGLLRWLREPAGLSAPA